MCGYPHPRQSPQRAQDLSRSLQVQVLSVEMKIFFLHQTENVPFSEVSQVVTELFWPRAETLQGTCSSASVSALSPGGA